MQCDVCGVSACQPPGYPEAHSGHVTSGNTTEAPAEGSVVPDKRHAAQMKYCTCHSLDKPGKHHAEWQTPLTKTTHSAAPHMTCGAERSAPTARRLVAAGAGGRAAAQRRRWKRPEADCGDGAHGEGTNSCELHSLNG